MLNSERLTQVDAAPDTNIPRQKIRSNGRLNGSQEVDLIDTAIKNGDWYTICKQESEKLPLLSPQEEIVLSIYISLGKRAKNELIERFGLTDDDVDGIAPGNLDMSGRDLSLEKWNTTINKIKKQLSDLPKHKKKRFEYPDVRILQDEFGLWSSNFDEDHLRKVVAVSKAAKERMFHSNRGLVIDLADDYDNELGENKNDLIDEGYIGLLIAIDKFEFIRGNKFATYATWRIRQFISGYEIYKNNPVRIDSNDYYYFVKPYKDFVKNFIAENGEIPNLEEIMAGTGFDIDEIEQIEHYFNLQPTSLDSGPVDNEGEPMHEYIGDVHQTPVETSSLKAVTNYRVRQIIDEHLASTNGKNNPKYDLLEKQIIYMYFGIGFDAPFKPREIIKQYSQIWNDGKIPSPQTKPKLNKDKIRNTLTKFNEGFEIYCMEIFGDRSHILELLTIYEQ